MTITIHAGFHKTGTTAIQSFMQEHREELDDFGLVYPSFSSLGARNEAGHFRFASGLADGSLSVEATRHLLQEAKGRDKNLLLSAESLIRYSIKKSPDEGLWTSKRNYIEKVRSALPVQEPEVVFVYRNPFDLIQSYYNEAVKKTGCSVTLGEYAWTTFTQYDPVSTLSLWSSVFKTVSVRSYEADRKHPRGLVGAILETYCPSYPVTSEASVLNKSFPSSAIDLIRRLNPVLHPRERAVVMNALECTKDETWSRKTLWSSEEITLFQSKFVSDADFILARFGCDVPVVVPRVNDEGAHKDDQERLTQILRDKLPSSILEKCALVLTDFQGRIDKTAYPEAGAKRHIRNDASTTGKMSRLGEEYEYGSSKSWPFFKSPFKISGGSKVFLIGSCFARNMEEYLAELNLEVPTAHFTAPPREWPGRTTGILNKYTPPAIYQAIEWSSRIWKRDDKVREEDLNGLVFKTKSGEFLDLQLPSSTPVPYERLIERRGEIYSLYRHIFDSELVTITLGLTEAWFDNDTGLYIDSAPVSRDLLASRGRFTLHNITTAEAEKYITSAVDLISDINSSVKFVITTSPVPLIRTYAGESQVVANCYSKSTLRSACDAIVRHIGNERGVYFPSYEMVTASKSWDFWQRDLQHIKSGGVAQLAAFFVDHMIEDVPVDQREWIAAKAFSNRNERLEALEFAKRLAARTGDPVHIAQRDALEALKGIPKKAETLFSGGT